MACPPCGRQYSEKPSRGESLDKILTAIDFLYVQDIVTMQSETFGHTISRSFLGASKMIATTAAAPAPKSNRRAIDPESPFAEVGPFDPSQGGSRR